MTLAQVRAPRPWPLQVFKSSFRGHETLGLTAITASSAPPAAGKDKPLPLWARSAMASPDLGGTRPRLVKRRLDGHGHNRRAPVLHLGRRNLTPVDGPSGRLESDCPQIFVR
ncbi:hypothetical protein NL676_031813 [Syzygium grande]|nr:hypothetical protein NL676_031813 [Syzygium grande]